MKKLLFSTFLLVFTFYSYASFRAFFPKNAQLGKQVLQHADTLLETQTVTLDTNGYLLLVNSNGAVIELDSAGDYFLDKFLMNFPENNYKVTKELQSELITFLGQNPGNIKYKRLGYVCNHVFNESVIILSERESFWYKGIPLTVYFHKKNLAEVLKLSVKNLFIELQHEAMLNSNFIPFSSDSLFDSLVKSDEDDILNSTFHYGFKNNRENQDFYTIKLKQDITLSQSYNRILSSNYSDFVKKLLETAFFIKNDMELYRLSSLVKLNKFAKNNTELKELLALEATRRSRHLGRVYSMIVNAKN